MSTTSHVHKKTTAILAIIFLLPALYLFIMWSTVSVKNPDVNAQEQMNIFIHYFPSWLQKISTVHAISIVSCVVAIILATRSFNKRLLSIRLLMMLVVIAAFFILLFDIYQMV